MVDVTHDGDDGGTGHHVFLTVHFLGLGDGLLHVGAHEIDLETEFAGHHREGFGIEALVDGHRHTQAHAGGDDLGHRHAHHHGQVVGGDKLRHLQHRLFLLLAHLFLHHAAGHLLAFLTAVLGGFRLTHWRQTGEGVFDLFRDLLVGEFHLLLVFGLGFAFILLGLLLALRLGSSLTRHAFGFASDTLAFLLLAVGAFR